MTTTTRTTTRTTTPSTALPTTRTTARTTAGTTARTTARPTARAAVRQRYVRPRTELEGLCCISGCPRDISEQVTVVLAGRPTSAGMCGRHAPAYRDLARD